MPETRPTAAPDDLDSVASRAGEDWASIWMTRLREEQRAVVGGWPGTLSEARSQVLHALAGAQPSLSSDRMHALSRVAYRAARIAWQRMVVADDER